MTLSGLWDQLVHFVTGERERAMDALRAGLLFLFAIAFAGTAGRFVRRLVAAGSDAQRALLVGRLTSWAVFILGVAGALDELGFKLRVVLGAAGVATVAIGFAAQTTLSNLVSGFFLFGERPFGIGDVIEIDGMSGEVLSIDMMATTLRTFDNRFLRIPNELVIKTKVVNLTRFPLRRLDLTIPIAHEEDFPKVRAVLLEIAEESCLCLAEPPPAAFISSFGETSVQVQLWLWTRTEKLQELRVTVTQEIQRKLAGVKRTKPT